MKEEEALKEALKVIPKYPNTGICGCGEGRCNEQCDKFTDLMNDEYFHCVLGKK